MNDWIAFYNSDHSIYVNARHRDVHFRRIATRYDRRNVHFLAALLSPAPYNGCLLNVSSAELASRAAASTCARRSALEQEGPLALIAGERGRVLELAPRLDHAADPE